MKYHSSHGEVRGVGGPEALLPHSDVISRLVVHLLFNIVNEKVVNERDMLLLKNKQRNEYVTVRHKCVTPNSPSICENRLRQSD